MTHGADSGTRSRLGRAFWFAIGSIALILGTIGIVLPVLPTTPFAILAAFAFGKSSPAVEAWLERNRYFGPIIADWRANGVIAPRYKSIAVVMMCGAFIMSIALSVAPIVLIVEAVCLSGAALFVLTRPSRAP